MTKNLQILSLVLTAIVTTTASVSAQAVETVASRPADAHAPAAPVLINPSTSPSVTSHEDWKGKVEEHQFALSALTGLGIVNATPGFALIGAAATKIVKQGFIPDINNMVWLEAQVGPVFAKGGTALQFSTHLRWDFVKDDDWTFYGLGGVGGANCSANLGDKFEIYPRFGAGALWKIFADFTLRGEISHELTVVGAQFEF